MKEDETGRLAVIWRGVTDDWPTHSSTYAGMLLLQIGPIDPPLPPHHHPPSPWHFVCNRAAKCWLFGSSRHDGSSKFNPCSLGKIMSFKVLDFQYCFCHRPTRIKALHMTHYCGYSSMADYFSVKCILFRFCLWKNNVWSIAMPQAYFTCL